MTVGGWPYPPPTSRPKNGECIEKLLRLFAPALVVRSNVLTEVAVDCRHYASEMSAQDNLARALWKIKNDGDLVFGCGERMAGQRVSKIRVECFLSVG